MSTAVMMERIAKESPRFKARIAGVFYFTIVTRVIADAFVRNFSLHHIVVNPRDRLIGCTQKCYRKVAEQLLRC